MSAAAMTCSEVRERLGELSLGIVPAEEARRIEWHLQSCAGCRKEQAELQEGAATLAFSLPPADPPPSLEHRVIDRVAQASGRRVPAQAHRQLRTQVRRLASVAVAAAILASLSVGWAVSERNRAGDVQRATELQAQRLPREVAKLIDSLGRPAVEVALSPTPGRQGTGTATIVSVPRQDDFILVTAYLVDSNHGPYTLRLETTTGRIVEDGQLQRTQSGTLIFSDRPGLDLSKVQFVSVLDRQARPVMTGRVPAVRASPTP